MSDILRLAALLLVALPSLGCGPRGAARGSPEAADDTLAAVATDPADAAATLVIENSSIWDVRIFAVRSTQNVRLGVVTSGTTATFPLPARLLGDLVILADPIGARARLRTDSFVARRDDEVKITLEKRLRSYGISIH